VYLDDLMAAGRLDLAMVGVSLRSADVPDALDAQDGLYTLGVVRGTEVEARVIGSVLYVLHGPTQHDEVRSALAAPSTHVITMTVTEKGYCSNPATGRLDLTHPDIVHDLAVPDVPHSMPGHIVLAAADRRAHGAGPVTVLSLDNIPANGVLLRNAVLALATAGDPPWPTGSASTCASRSMVDRMTPATDDAFRVIAEANGLSTHGR
jgi:fructuronate reductase